MFKVEMENMTAILQQFDPKEFLLVVVQVKEKFISPAPRFRSRNLIWEIKKLT